MTIRKHKKGLTYKKGDEISFYQDGEVRTGTVCFVGNGSLSVYPCTAEVLGANGSPIKGVEYRVKEEDIL